MIVREVLFFGLLVGGLQTSSLAFSQILLPPPPTSIVPPQTTDEDMERDLKRRRTQRRERQNSQELKNQKALDKDRKKAVLDQALKPRDRKDVFLPVPPTFLHFFESNVGRQTAAKITDRLCDFRPIRQIGTS